MSTAARHESEMAAARSPRTGLASPHLVTFAGVLLALLGFLNGLDGIAAIARSHVFVGNAHYVFGDLRAWGWVMLFLAVVQFAAAYGVLVARAEWGRWTGVVVLGLNVFAQMAFIPSYPFWSLTIIAIDVLGIYGLTAYGSLDRRITTSDGGETAPAEPPQATRPKAA